MSQAGVITSQWMTDTFDVIGPLRLRDVAIPGVHDAGMSIAGPCTAGILNAVGYRFVANPCNSQTQELDVEGQLLFGARYFDFRPLSWPAVDGFCAGHFSDSFIGWLGCAGQDLESVYKQVGSFMLLPGSEREVVILKFSHFLRLLEVQEGAESGERSAPFDYDTAHAFIGELLTYLGPYLYTSEDPAINLNELSLAQIAGPPGNLRRVIAVFDGLPGFLIDPAIGIFQYAGSGTPGGNLTVYDNYSNTETFEFMVSDQIGKFTAFDPASGALFLLSWTLTWQPDFLAIFFSRSFGTCNDALAEGANMQLAGYVDDLIAQNVFLPGKIPNIIFIDYFGELSGVVDVCVTLNQLNKPTP